MQSNDMEVMKVHSLKIDKQPLDDLLSGVKTAEFRIDDRGFKVGDCVHLMEYIDGKIAFRSARRDITHIQRGYGIPEGFCVLSYGQSPISHGAGYTAVDMTTAAAQGFRDGVASVVVPEGWKLVPVEPTAEMLAPIVRNKWPEDWDAGKQLQRLRGPDVVCYNTETECAVGQYARMLDAAPSFASGAKVAE